VFFDISPEAYNRFMGRFSEPLAQQFADEAGLRSGDRVLDVGCGPGALTEKLVDRLGASAVTAIDPSTSFVEAVQVRFPDIVVRQGTAEQLPFADDGFDAALAQLVVHFMSDPVAGLREMGRVTKPGGVVMASVWDHAGEGTPLAMFWRAAKEVDPQATDESERAGSREGHLAELAAAAGLSDISSGSLSVTVTFDSFAQWWEPYTMGVGPAGAYVAGLEDAARGRLRTRAEELLPAAPFDITAKAWLMRARA
jgi:ubiquinone/menaquinone biosynthesis C-methylase UbiE